MAGGGASLRFVLLLSTCVWVEANNGLAVERLYCYQCNRTDKAPCPEENLLPCPPTKDRCVTHIIKDGSSGYRVRRECGLAPCTFEDEMMSRGLGLDRCDITREEVFCVFCCKENGCNRDSAASVSSSVLALTWVLLMHLWALVLAHNQ